MADRIAAVVTSFVVLATVTTIVIHGSGAAQAEGGFFNGLAKLTTASLARG